MRPITGKELCRRLNDAGWALKRIKGEIRSSMNTKLALRRILIVIGILSLFCITASLNYRRTI
jgi:hypothetical protein